MLPGIIEVFPTHVGMNRWGSYQRKKSIRIPHTRGDEPRVVRTSECVNSVFPTHVGMNRMERVMKDNLFTYSPHTWG